MTPEGIESYGLGLAKEEVRLARGDAGWFIVADALTTQIRNHLGVRAAAVEHIGSTSVPGLLAKPIVDIAVVLAADVSTETAVEVLEDLGYEYRGDAGNAGGLVFVLSVRPNHRVAHLHVLRPGDEQWDFYLSFRDRLRRDAQARADYENAKRALVGMYHHDRKAYTDGKDDVVLRLRVATADSSADRSS